MAQYNVNFSCGHREVVVLFGKEDERYRRIEYWEKNGICSACYREQKKIEAEAQAVKQGLQLREMTYWEYKTAYPTCKTAPGSYNGETKTIKVWVPAVDASVCGVNNETKRQQG